MAAKFSRHIALTGPLADYVETEVARGEYASASEMMRAALRLLKDRDEGKTEQLSRADHKTKEDRPA